MTMENKPYQAPQDLSFSTKSLLLYTACGTTVGH